METALSVDTPPRVWAAMWCGIVLMYTAYAMFLGLHSAAYILIPIKATSLVSNLVLLSIGVSTKYYNFIGGMYAAVAAIHVHSLVSMLVRSLRSRRLKFISRQSWVDVAVVAAARRLQTIADPILPHPLSRLRRLSNFVGSMALSIWRSFSVTSPNYGVVYIFRELIQTAVQTYQAYRLSAFVARTWMNWVIVSLLVLNCWATPLIQWSVRSSEGRARLLCVLVNLALDFNSCVVIPAALIFPYYVEFQPAVGNFVQTFLYIDEYLIKVVYEWQMIFVTSFWDGLSKFYIAFIISRSLRSIPRLLRLRSMCTVVVTVNRNSSSHSLASVVPETQSAATSDKHQLQPQQVGRQPWQRRAERFGHRILLLWGLVVLVLHVQSAATTSNEKCIIQVRPWLTTRPVCLLMEISCHHGRRSGNASDFDSALGSVQSDALAYLIIRHCETVEITPRIRELSSLLALKVYNSTLHKWGEDASLTQTFNPRMLFVFMVVIKAQAVPPGLYNRDFPRMLCDIELSDWNVISLPDEIADVWPAGMFLVVEKFQFPRFPPFLTKLFPGFLSVSFNNFTDIPREIWDNSGLLLLSLHGNPIRELPIHRPASPQFPWFDLVSTQVEILPDWVDGDSVLYVAAGSSPVCASLEEGNMTRLGVSESRMQYLQHYVMCQPKEEFDFLTFYPLTLEDTLNPTKNL